MKKKKILRDIGILLSLFVGVLIFYAYYPVDETEIEQTVFIDKEGDIKERLIKLMNYKAAGSDDSELMKALSEIQNLIQDSDFNYELLLSNSSDINTYLLPGNMIVVNRGLINMCEEPEELIGIVAHGVGHLKYNHISEKFIKSLEIELLLDSSNTTIAEVSELLINNDFSEESESMADDYAIKKLEELSISPSVLANLYKRLYTKSDHIPEFLTTHPSLNSRISKLSKFENNTVQRNYSFDWDKLEASL